MYKKGKHWVFASITASTIAIGAFTLTGLSASAEESTTVTEQTVSQPKTEENPEAKEYATTTVKTSTKAKKAVAKAAAATTESNITSVTKDNFEDHFVLNGSAKNQYNKNSGTVTLTPDEIDQSGNFALNEKIDLSKSFTLKGKINLGTKSKSQGGADGIGFAFHNGDPSTIGMSGGALGIGNLVSRCFWIQIRYFL